MNVAKYCISTIWVYHWSMLATFPGFVQGIHMHPTVPRIVAIDPNEVWILSADFQSFSTAILQIHQRRDEPSHRLKVAAYYFYYHYLSYVVIY